MIRSYETDGYEFSDRGQIAIVQEMQRLKIKYCSEILRDVLTSISIIGYDYDNSY